VTYALMGFALGFSNLNDDQFGSKSLAQNQADSDGGDSGKRCPGVLIPDLEEAPRFVVAVVNRAQGCGVERGHIVDHEAVEVTAAGDFEANGPHAIHALGDGVDRGRALFFRGADHEGHVFSLRGVESEYDGFGKCLVAWWHGCGLWMVGCEWWIAVARWPTPYRTMEIFQVRGMALTGKLEMRMSKPSPRDMRSKSERQFLRRIGVGRWE